VKNSVAIIGSNGYVGSSLIESFKSYGGYLLQAINRENFTKFEGEHFDFVINASNPAKRFLAEENPKRDYEETVEKTQYFLSNYRYGRFITISSLSVRTSPNSAYGSNRKTVENLVLARNNFVVRLGPIYGGKKRNSILQDLINNTPIKYSAETKYGYCDVNWTSKYLLTHLNQLNHIVEIGAKDSISLREVAEGIQSTSTFGHLMDDQFIDNFPDGPEAKSVIAHANSCKRNNEWCG